MNNFKSYFLFLSIFSAIQLRGADNRYRLNCFSFSYDPFSPENCSAPKEHVYNEEKFIEVSSNEFSEDDHKPMDQQEFLDNSVERWLKSSDKLIDLKCDLRDITDEQLQKLMKNVFSMVAINDGQRLALSIIRRYIPKRGAEPFWEKLEILTIQDLIATREKYLVALVGGELRGFLSEGTHASIFEILEAINNKSQKECSTLTHDKLVAYSPGVCLEYMKGKKEAVSTLVQFLQNKENDSEYFILTPSFIKVFSKKFDPTGYYIKGKLHETEQDFWKILYEAMNNFQPLLFKYILEMNAFPIGSGTKSACR